MGLGSRSSRQLGEGDAHLTGRSAEQEAFCLVRCFPSVATASSHSSETVLSCEIYVIFPPRIKFLSCLMQNLLLWKAHPKDLFSQLNYHSIYSIQFSTMSSLPVKDPYHSYKERSWHTFGCLCMDICSPLWMQGFCRSLIHVLTGVWSSTETCTGVNFTLRS